MSLTATLKFIFTHPAESAWQTPARRHEFGRAIVHRVPAFPERLHN